MFIYEEWGNKSKMYITKSERENYRKRVESKVTSEWESTRKINEKVGRNWFFTKKSLEHLERIGIVEKIRMGSGIMWRKKTKWKD